MEGRLEANLRDIVTKAIGHTPESRSLVIFDSQSPLSRLLCEGYRRALPEGEFLDFEGAAHLDVLARIESLAKGDLVVLVESTRFDLREFRFRLELFGRGLAVVEHPHLGRMTGEEVATYVDALAYDPGYYRTLGRALKKRLDAARSVTVHSEGGLLSYDGPFEEAKLNVGDYTGFKNIGGQFPIGEVFTEPADLCAARGSAKIFAFGDSSFRVRSAEPPFTLEVDSGRVTGAPGAPAEFEAILAAIRAEEGEVWIRELGFGLNRALTRQRRVADVGTYERMCGVHLSLGAKHAVYSKPVFKKRRFGFHVDIFVAVGRVEIDGEAVFENGDWGA